MHEELEELLRVSFSKNKSLFKQISIYLRLVLFLTQKALIWKAMVMG